MFWGINNYLANIVNMLGVSLCMDSMAKKPGNYSVWGSMLGTPGNYMANTMDTFSLMQAGGVSNDDPIGGLLDFNKIALETMPPLDPFEGYMSAFTNFWNPQGNNQNNGKVRDLSGFTYNGDRPDFITERNWQKIMKLNPQMQGAMVELYKRATEEGLTFNIGDGFRSIDEQRDRYESAVAKGRPNFAVNPDEYKNGKLRRSEHQDGRAVDLHASPQVKARLGKIWQSMGFRWGVEIPGAREDWHFDLKPTSAKVT